MRTLIVAPRIARRRGVDLQFVDPLHGPGVVPDDLAAGDEEDAEATQAFDVEREGVVLGEVAGIEGGLPAVLGLAFGNEADWERDRLACLARDGGFVRAAHAAGDVACGDLAGAEQHLEPGAVGPDASDGDAFAGFEDEDEMEWGGGNDGGQSMEDHGGSFGGAGLTAGLIDAAIRDVGSRAEAAESTELGGGDDALEGLADRVEVEGVTHAPLENSQGRRWSSREAVPD